MAVAARTAAPAFHGMPPLAVNGDTPQPSRGHSATRALCPDVLARRPNRGDVGLESPTQPRMPVGVGYGRVHFPAREEPVPRRNAAALAEGLPGAFVKGLHKLLTFVRGCGFIPEALGRSSRFLGRVL